MKRWIMAGLVLALLLGSTGAIGAVAAQSAPAAGPVREFEVEDGHLIGLSPDGTMYAMVVADSALCVYSTETLQEISCGSLEALNAGISYQDIVWAPDSSKLAFAEKGFIYIKDGDLWVMDARTGMITNVTDDGYGGRLIPPSSDQEEATFFMDVAPAWTPDSRFITFSRSTTASKEHTGTVLAQVPASGGEVETLATVSTTEPGVVFAGVGWAPDGQTFYFSVTHAESDDRENGIWTYDATTGEIAPFATADAPELGPLMLLKVSPAGDRLLAWYPQAFGQFSYSGPLLRLVDVATGALTPVEIPDDDSSFNSGVMATFSPDGQALLVQTRLQNGQNQLWVIDLVSGTPTMLLDGLDQATFEFGLTPTWGANGAVALGHGPGAGYLTSITGVGTDIAPAETTPVASAGTPVSQGVPVGGEVRDVDLPDGRAVSMSPDGQLLAVAVLPSESLCVYQVETMAQVSCADLTGLVSGIRVEDVVWSPDSTRLAFGENAFRYFRDGDLWVMDARSGQLTNLTDDSYDGDVMLVDEEAEDTTYYIDISPAWTPDGQFITFSRSTFTGKERFGNTVAQVPAVGGEVETLATVSADVPGVYYFRAAWSPDGASFYYSVNYPETSNPDNGIWVYEKASGQTRLLAKSDDTELGPLTLREVSPAGDRLLAYYPSALMQMGYVGRSVLRFVDPATGALSPVPDPAPESEIWEGTWIATFSPDGQYFLQAHGMSGESRDFWVTNLTTGESTEVANDLAYALPIEYALGPVWASNGLVFVAKSVVGAYFFPIEGAGTAEVTPVVPVAGSPVSGDAQFAPGSDVQTNGVTPIFAGPDANATVVGFLAPNQVVQVIAAPIENEQGVWYPIFDPDTQIIGYVQANRLKEIA